MTKNDKVCYSITSGLDAKKAWYERQGIELSITLPFASFEEPKEKDYITRLYFRFL